MKKIIVFALLVLFSAQAQAADITFTFTNKQILIVDAAAKKIYKGKVTAKQLMKKHMLDILQTYKYQLKEIRNNEMTDQEETDMLNNYNQ